MDFTREPGADILRQAAGLDKDYENEYFKHCLPAGSRGDRQPAAISHSWRAESAGESFLKPFDADQLREVSKKACELIMASNKPGNMGGAQCQSALSDLYRDAANRGPEGVKSFVQATNKELAAHDSSLRLSACYREHYEIKNETPNHHSPFMVFYPPKAYETCYAGGEFMLVDRNNWGIVNKIAVEGMLLWKKPACSSAQTPGLPFIELL